MSLGVKVGISPPDMRENKFEIRLDVKTKKNLTSTKILHWVVQILIGDFWSTQAKQFLSLSKPAKSWRLLKGRVGKPVMHTKCQINLPAVLELQKGPRSSMHGRTIPASTGVGILVVCPLPSVAMFHILGINLQEQTSRRNFFPCLQNIYRFLLLLFVGIKIHHHVSNFKWIL